MVETSRRKSGECAVLNDELADIVNLVAGQFDDQITLESLYWWDRPKHGAPSEWTKLISNLHVNQRIAVIRTIGAAKKGQVKKLEVLGDIRKLDEEVLLKRWILHLRRGGARFLVRASRPYASLATLQESLK